MKKIYEETKKQLKADILTNFDSDYRVHIEVDTNKVSKELSDIIMSETEKFVSHITKILQEREKQFEEDKRNFP